MRPAYYQQDKRLRNRQWAGLRGSGIFTFLPEGGGGVCIYVNTSHVGLGDPEVEK